MLRLVHIILIASLLFLSLQAYSSVTRLANTDWLESSERRSLLYFITQCALDSNQMLRIENHGVVFEFYGQLGAAPNWDGYPSSISEREQRWVSACVLARVNYFGTPVPLNLRTWPNDDFYIHTTQKQREDFPFFEGGFFGNIFTHPAKKYVCTGDTAAQILIGKNRICTLPSISSDRISECGFVIVGSCDNDYLFERDGIIYNEVIFSWLRMH